MNIKNAEQVYKHYGILRPAIIFDNEKTIKVLKRIGTEMGFTYYTNAVIRYILDKNTNINDFIYYDHYEKMLKYSRINRSVDIDVYYRRIFERCNECEVTRLALELCILTDMQMKISFYDLHGVEGGLGEALLGIFPYSLLRKATMKSILMNLKIPLPMMKTIKMFLAYYRTHDKSKRGIDIDNTTLISIKRAITNMILDMSITNWKVLDGYEGVMEMKKYFEKKRERKTRNEIIEYQYDFQSGHIDRIRVFMSFMWKQMGLSGNPFMYRNSDGEIADDKKQIILQSLSLPLDGCAYHGMKKIDGQQKVKIINEDGSEDYIDPCFTKDQFLQLCEYIERRWTEILNGNEPDINKLTLMELDLYYQRIQGDLILAYSLANFCRPIDFYATNLEQFGKYNMNLNDLAHLG